MLAATGGSLHDAAPPKEAMSVDAATVRHIARLARIAVSDEEVSALAPELSNILGWIEQLGEVDVSGVEPMTAVIPNHLRLRDDVVTNGGIRDAVLANAPKAEHGFFVVPKVIE
jgi:aspartyl-tRNA(Asn)/glutamyl-tRNA(Gln) amidotransferase subunit C